MLTGVARRGSRRLAFRFRKNAMRGGTSDNPQLRSTPPPICRLNAVAGADTPMRTRASPTRSEARGRHSCSSRARRASGESRRPRSACFAAETRVRRRKAERRLDDGATSRGASGARSNRAWPHAARQAL